jgi:glyoxylase-like metal-dependent hydrolase (beta-lactamase superfamily II)
MEDMTRIHSIQTGRVQIKQAQIEGRGRGFWRQIQPIVSSEWAERVPVYAWAIEHPEGVIVVETGSGAREIATALAPYFQLAMRFDIELEQEVGPQLRSLGIGERDVKTLVLTHLHIDHDGGLAHFPHSRTRQRRDRARGWHRRCDPGLSAKPVAAMVRAAAFPLAAIVLWAFCAQRPHHRRRRRDRSADAGTHAKPRPVIVRNGDEQIMLAGDASYLEEAMLSGTIDGVSPDESAAKTTLADTRALCAARPNTYLPTHDPRSAERLAARRTAAAGPCGERLSTASQDCSAVRACPL